MGARDELTVTVSPDREMVCMSKGTWRGAFPVEKLPQTLEFYRGLRDRRGGAYARFYVEDVAALEAIEKELKCPKT